MIPKGKKKPVMANVTERQRAELNVMVDEVNRIINLAYGTDDFDLRKLSFDNRGGNAYGRASYGRALYYYIVDNFMHSISEKAKSSVAISILHYDRTAYYSWERKHHKMLAEKDQTYLDILDMVESLSSRIRVEGWIRSRTLCVQYIDDQIAKLEERKKGYLKSVEVREKVMS